MLPIWSNLYANVYEKIKELVINCVFVKISSISCSRLSNLIFIVFFVALENLCKIRNCWSFFGVPFYNKNKKYCSYKNRNKTISQEIVHNIVSLYYEKAAQSFFRVLHWNHHHLNLLFTRIVCDDQENKRKIWRELIFATFHMTFCKLKSFKRFCFCNFFSLLF